MKLIYKVETKLTETEKRLVVVKGEGGQGGLGSQQRWRYDKKAFPKGLLPTSLLVSSHSSPPP